MTPDEVGHRTDTGVAELLADDDRPGGWLLTLDRIAQSYVDLDDPTYLEFEYVQGFAEIVDAVLPPGERLDVTHVGGGALTFPRHLVHTRPGSSQIVLEPDAALTALVRRHLPLPPRSGIRVRPVPGRAGLAALAAGSADLVVLDAFAGGRVPGDLTTDEAFAEVDRVLRPGGLLVANIADGPPLAHARRVLAGVRAHLGHVLVRADPAVLRRRHGNLVVAASVTALPAEEITRQARSAMLPVTVVAGRELDRLVADAKPWTDSDSAASPAPSAGTWRLGG